MRILVKIGIAAMILTALFSTFPLQGTLHKWEMEQARKVDDAHVMVEQGVAIDRYFERRHMPLAGYGREMAQAARANNIDWRLLPAIAVRESSGGIESCGTNVFGWASCRLTFSSISEGIKTVARNLGGNATSTAAYYRGKTTHEILSAYNPPSIVPHYAEQVEAIMETIY